MKLRQIEVERFGRFEKLSLELQTRQGLTVILGQNEAGKSTLREALLSFLFGIPLRLGPKYLYDGKARKDIRLVAQVMLDKGEEFEAVRTGKKGDQSLTGVNSQGQSLTPQILKRQLGTLDRAMYSSLFGFSLEDLSKGAEGLRHSSFQDLIEGGALGGAGNLLKDLRSELKALCESEFTTTQKKSALVMQAFGECQELSVKMRELSMRKGAIQELLDRRAELNQRLVELESEQSTLSRDRSIITMLRLKVSTWEELASLRARVESGELLSSLKDETEIERLQLEIERWNLARQEFEQLNGQLQVLTAEHGQFQIQEELLASGSQVDDLKEQLTHIAELRSNLDALDDESKQSSERLEQAKSKHAELFSETLDAQALLGVEADDSLHATLTNACDLAGQREQDLHGLEGKLGLLTHSLASREQELAAFELKAPDAKLLSLFSELDSVSAQEQEEAAVRKSISVLQGELRAEVATLSPEVPAIDSLHTLRLPARTDLEPLVAREQERDLRHRRESERQREARTELCELRERMEALQTPVGSENVLQDLLEARKHRDELWSQLEAWLSRGSHSSETLDPTLSTDLRDAIQAADVAADALASAREQDLRVASLQAEIVRQQAKLNASVQARETLDSESAQDGAQLVALFAESGVEVAGFRAAALMEWWERFQTARKLSSTLAIKTAECDQLSLKLSSFVNRARASLPDQSPVTLREVLVVLADLKGSHDDATAEKRHLEQTVKQERRAASQLAEQVERQRAHLRDARSPKSPPWAHLGWPKELTVEQAMARLNSTNQVASLSQKATQAAAESQSARDHIERFEKAISTIQSSLPDSVPSPPPEVASSPEALVRFLGELLSEARKTQQRYQDHERKIASVAAQVEQRKDSLSKIESLLELARVEYEAADLPALAALVRRAAEALPWLIEQRKLSESLKPHNVSLKEARERLDSGGAEVLANRERALGERLKDLDDEHRDIAAQLRQLELNERSWGGSESAEIQAELSEARATLQQVYEQHAVHRVAFRLLSDAAEQWRRRNQPKLIEKTQRFLSSLTEGRYVGLKQKLGEDSFVLLHRDGSERSEETLSLGTAQQSFFALRLAFAEIWCEENEPLPILIDDALVNFDLARQRASLRTLGELSRQTQVILLTCHPHLAELAAQEVEGTRIINLGETTAATLTDAQPLKKRASP